jgi:hypothetical protein
MPAGSTGLSSRNQLQRRHVCAQRVTHDWPSGIDDTHAHLGVTPTLSKANSCIRRLLLQHNMAGRRRMPGRWSSLAWIRSSFVWEYA